MPELQSKPTVESRESQLCQCPTIGFVHARMSYPSLASATAYYQSREYSLTEQHTIASSCSQPSSVQLVPELYCSCPRVLSRRLTVRQTLPLMNIVFGSLVGQFVSYFTSGSGSTEEQFKHAVDTNAYVPIWDEILLIEHCQHETLACILCIYLLGNLYWHTYPWWDNLYPWISIYISMAA